MMKSAPAGLTRMILVSGMLLSIAGGIHAGQILFDEGWRFHPGAAAGAEAPGFRDRKWQRINLPHDWSIERPTDPDAPAGGAGGYFPTGVGWYRKTFPAPSEWQGRRVWIEFEGIYQNASVWINGIALGTHAYGYTPFRFDLTPHLRTRFILFTCDGPGRSAHQTCPIGIDSYIDGTLSIGG